MVASTPNPKTTPIAGLKSILIQEMALPSASDTIRRVNSRSCRSTERFSMAYGFVREKVVMKTTEAQTAPVQNRRSRSVRERSLSIPSRSARAIVGVRKAPAYLVPKASPANRELRRTFPRENPRAREVTVYSPQVRKQSCRRSGWISTDHQKTSGVESTKADAISPVCSS